MGSGIRFLLNRISERLWVKPLLMCLISVGLVLLVTLVDTEEIAGILPDISVGSLETLLTTISSSMMVIATLAVASMVSAYASASQTATPRSFALIVADDVSQNALSTFIGAFIFSIIALIALKNDLYGNGGRFALFILTLAVFAIVILTFVRWVDRIARLGRMGNTISKVEAATSKALKLRRRAPSLCAMPAGKRWNDGLPLYGVKVGYIQRIDVSGLQRYAEKHRLLIRVESLPGGFSAPDRILVYVAAESGDLAGIDMAPIEKAFRINDDRTFDDDPRFGLVVLSEIAGRALSPGVNDPGTALQVLASFVRLFTEWATPVRDSEKEEVIYNRVTIPVLSVDDMFEDAFTAIARDGAGTLEVAVRLQKAFLSLAATGDPALKEAAREHSRLALARAERAMTLPEDLHRVRSLADSID